MDDTPVHKAVREALANCLVNADYYGRGGLVIIKRRNEITMANPANFRIEIAAYIGLKPSRARDYLAELISEGIVVAEGGNRNRTYRLKS